MVAEKRGICCYFFTGSVVIDVPGQIVQRIENYGLRDRNVFLHTLLRQIMTRIVPDIFRLILSNSKVGKCQII